MDSLATRSVAAKRLKRIAGMSLAELRYRGRQQGSKWIDRWRPDAPQPDAREVLRREAPQLDSHALLDAVKRSFDERFFPGAGPRAAADHEPSHVDAITVEADRLLAGRFDLLGYRDLQFGDPICSGIAIFSLAIRSTGSSIRFGSGGRRPCIGARSMSLIPQWSATARSCGS